MFTMEGKRPCIRLTDVPMSLPASVSPAGSSARVLVLQPTFNQCNWLLFSHSPVCSSPGACLVNDTESGAF